jgi:hypothetical protein
MVAIARVPAVRRTSRLINGGLWPNLLLLRAFIPSCENLLDSVEPPVEEGGSAMRDLPLMKFGLDLRLYLVNLSLNGSPNQSDHPRQDSRFG